jgi:predicted metal-dependent HD superfamily phosphohydrolase
MGRSASTLSPHNIIGFDDMTSVVTSSDEEDAVVVARLQRATSLRSNDSFDAYPSLQDELRVHWGAAVPSSLAATSTSTSTECWFDRIYRQHNEAGRYYHTAVHLKEMLDYLQLLSPPQEEFVRSLRLAIFFHDVVYDPQSNRNEKDSAKLFQVFCNESTVDDDDENSSIPTTIQHQVVTLILATETHQIIPGTDDESLQEIFLDLDMAVLGKDSKAYLAYAALIRKEYSCVPRQVYCEKRAEILQGFLQKPRIYLSPPFHRALEEPARRNLQEEINLLQKGVIPGETEGK